MKQIKNWAGVVLIFLVFACEKQAVNEEILGGTVNFPRGEEHLFMGGTYELHWTLADANAVCIELWKGDEKVEIIAEHWDESNRYVWTVDKDIQESDDYTIKVIDEDNSEYFAENRYAFALQEAGEKSLFVDVRDGKSYQTVQIGSQVWLAENFNYFINSKPKDYSNLTVAYEGYGQLYSRDEALAICPYGWHLPSDDEWQVLERFLGIPEEELAMEGNRGRYQLKLLIPSGGVGFDALYGGYYNEYADLTGHVGWESHFWTSTVSQQGFPIVRILSKFHGGVARLATFRHGGSSVRYVKD